MGPRARPALLPCSCCPPRARSVPSSRSPTLPSQQQTKVLVSFGSREVSSGLQRQSPASSCAVSDSSCAAVPAAPLGYGCCSPARRIPALQHVHWCLMRVRGATGDQWRSLGLCDRVRRGVRPLCGVDRGPQCSHGWAGKFSGAARAHPLACLDSNISMASAAVWAQSGLWFRFGLQEGLARFLAPESLAKGGLSRRTTCAQRTHLPLHPKLLCRSYIGSTAYGALSTVHRRKSTTARSPSKS